CGARTSTAWITTAGSGRSGGGYRSRVSTSTKSSASLFSSERPAARCLLVHDELIGDVVFVDVTDVGDGFAAGLTRGDHLHVAEPFIGIEPGGRGFLPQLRHSRGSGVVGRDREETLVETIHRLVLVVLVHDESQVLRARLDVFLRAYVHAFDV